MPEKEDTMQAVVITEPGNARVLQVMERPVPQVERGEIGIKVIACGINRPDIIQRKGKYPAPKGVDPDIPGLEVAGIVDKVGPGVHRFRPGDRVCALLAGGGYATYAVAPAGQCLPIPVGLSFEEAASLPETYFTVWSNIFDRAAFRKGERFLVHGGTSGIGVAAIQMVKAMGGKVYATAGTDEKCRFCESLGAERGINYREEDYEAILRAEGGVDIILDMVGGDYTSRNLNSLREDGRLVIINAMKNKSASIDLMRIMVKRLVITGSTLRARDPDFKKAIAENLHKHIWPLVAEKKIRPVIYASFSFRDASYAHELMESGVHLGKIILLTG